MNQQNPQNMQAIYQFIDSLMNSNQNQQPPVLPNGQYPNQSGPPTKYGPMILGNQEQGPSAPFMLGYGSGDENDDFSPLTKFGMSGASREASSPAYRQGMSAGPGGSAFAGSATPMQSLMGLASVNRNKPDPFMNKSNNPYVQSLMGV